MGYWDIDETNIVPKKRGARIRRPPWKHNALGESFGAIAQEGSALEECSGGWADGVIAMLFQLKFCYKKWWIVTASPSLKFVCGLQNASVAATECFSTPDFPSSLPFDAHPVMLNNKFPCIISVGPSKYVASPGTIRHHVAPPSHPARSANIWHHLTLCSQMVRACVCH